jgi:hypothetical protein
VTPTSSDFDLSRATIGVLLCTIQKVLDNAVLLSQLRYYVECHPILNLPVSASSFLGSSSSVDETTVLASCRALNRS